jgi:hypothetical protein
MLIIAALVALAINGAFVGWAIWINMQRPTVELTDLIVEDDTTICPDETLDYNFSLSVSRQADVDLNTSVESAEPHTTVAYSRFQRYSFDSQTTVEIGRQWSLPLTYLDPVTGRQRFWSPGEYVQIVSANVIGGRDTPTEVEIPFTIPPSCSSH